MKIAGGSKGGLLVKTRPTASSGRSSFVLGRARVGQTPKFTLLRMRVRKASGLEDLRLAPVAGSRSRWCKSSTTKTVGDGRG